MKNNHKKQNNSKFSNYFLTYLISSFIILFTLSFSLIAEPNPSGTDSKTTSNTVLPDSVKKTAKNNITTKTPTVNTVKNETATGSDNSLKESEKANEDTTKQKEKEEFLKQVKELENQRRKLSLEIYQQRVKLIKENPELQSLQRSIMDMHRKMASKLNEKNSMKVLLKKARQVDAQIIEAINKNKPLASKEKTNGKLK